MGCSKATAKRAVRELKAAGLLQLKGHKSVGGMRASIYNAMPIAGVQALVEHMLSLGANVGARDSLGWTPLHTAARAGAAAACTCLLAAGADVHARGGLGVTPLEVCSGEEVRLALLHAGAELTPSRGASRAGSSRADSSEPPSEPPSGPPSGSASARGSSRDGGGVSVAGLDVSLRPVVTVDGTVRAGSFVPHPPSSRPVSSRHAQRLRAQVQGADAG
jgi:hypothetical protein